MSHRRFCFYLWGILLGFASHTALAQEQRFGFDQAPAGGLPPGWTIAATNPGGPLAEWRLRTDPGATSPPQVLAIARIRDDLGMSSICAGRARCPFRTGPSR